MIQLDASEARKTASPHVIRLTEPAGMPLRNLSFSAGLSAMRSSSPGFTT